MGVTSIRWWNDRIIRWLVAEELPPEMPLCNFERIRAVAQPCDVILVEGKSRVSEVIKVITQSPWSHALLFIGSLERITDPEIRGLVARFHDGDPKEQLVVEALMGQGVVVTPLREYRHHHLRICRPKGLSSWDAQKVLHFGVRHLGCDYDFRQILDLARFLLPYGILPRRLGSSLFQRNAGRSTATVCSSLLARAFMSVHFPIIPIIQRDEQGDLKLFQRNFRLFTPRDFDVSPYFEIIKYPLLGHDDLANYRNLPWDMTGLVYNAENDCFSASQSPSTSPRINPALAAYAALRRKWRQIFSWPFSLPSWGQSFGEKQEDRKAPDGKGTSPPLALFSSGLGNLSSDNKGAA